MSHPSTADYAMSPYSRQSPRPTALGRRENNAPHPPPSSSHGHLQEQGITLSSPPTAIPLVRLFVNGDNVSVPLPDLRMDNPVNPQDAQDEMPSLADLLSMALAEEPLLDDAETPPDIHRFQQPLSGTNS
eukprot:CAMPEP_0168790324 /NCGR_PEP_ID=MMETSP0725-20121227/13339_1 /TAXON_ID=265536 /ORGANISM="Amphiprora sp., Strain CCMP467" /LENGTH=129 /DNA_ID=CAMNT_0008840721 /DNA_START=44 /DNA_END=433 /DNA_ORIENTATION=-